MHLSYCEIKWEVIWIKKPHLLTVSADGRDKSLAPLLNEHICRGTLQLDLKGYVGLAMLVTKLRLQECWILSKKAEKRGGFGLAVSVTKGKTDGLTKNQKDLCTNPSSATGEHGSCLHRSLKHPHTLIHSGLHFIYCGSHKIWMPNKILEDTWEQNGNNEV